MISSTCVVQQKLELESSAAQEDVSVVPAPTREEVNDDDHETSDQVTTKPRRTTRMRATSEWYVILSEISCCWTTMNL